MKVIKFINVRLEMCDRDPDSGIEAAGSVKMVDFEGDKAQSVLSAEFLQSLSDELAAITPSLDDLIQRKIVLGDINAQIAEREAERDRLSTEIAERHAVR